MRPIIDISSKNSFTIWESCVQRTSYSSSILVSDQDSNKMKVIYDRDPSKSSTHALFYANVGNILAGCFIEKKNSPKKVGVARNPRTFRNLRPKIVQSTLIESSVRVELVRIESLSTKTVQGRTVPHANLAPLYLSVSQLLLEFGSSTEPNDEPDFKTLIGAYEDLPSIPNGRMLMEQAVLKAMTPQSAQRMFWGIPRTKQEE